MNNLEGYKEHLIALGYSPTTINYYLHYASKLGEVTQDNIDSIINIYNHNQTRAALQSYVVDYLQRYDIKIKFAPKVLKNKRIGLSPLEWGFFTDKLNKRDILIARVLKESGFRVSEILGVPFDEEKGLKPSSIDKPEKGYLWVKIKGRRWDKALISDELRADLLKYIEKNHIKGDERIFNIYSRMLWQIFNKVSAEAGIRHVHPHLLKHTTSRDCDEKGISIDGKLVILHEKRAQTIIDHYHNPESKKIWEKLRS